MVRQIQAEQFLLASEPFVVGHRRHAGQIRLAALPLTDDLRRPVAHPVDARQQAAALAQAVGRAGSDQALEHSLVHFARIGANTEIEHGLERPVPPTLVE